MFEHWHDLAILKSFLPDSLFAEIRVALDSPWFNGHFPGERFLPGVAVLTMGRGNGSTCRTEKK